MNEELKNRLEELRRQEEVEKKKLIIANLLPYCYKIASFQFFDFDSDEMLDKKIEIMKKIKDGGTPDDIPEYFDILENYPKNKKIVYGP